MIYTKNGSLFAENGRSVPFAITMHRGGNGDGVLPEETIPAFQESAVKGVVGFEIDAVTTSDGVEICCHSNPVTDKDGKEWSISGNTWATLKNVVLASTQKYGDIKLCSLDNALNYCYTHGKFLVIDSVGSASEATKIATQVVNAGMAGKCIYMLVFHTTDVADIGSAILAVDKRAKIGIDYNAGLTYAKSINNDDAVIVLMKKALLTDSAISEIRSNGYPWYLWDVNVTDPIDSYINMHPDYFQFMQGDNPLGRIHAVIDAVDFGKGIR